MPAVWIVRTEISALLDPIRGGRAFGFINIVVSAEDAAEAESLVREMLRHYEWDVLGVEGITQADPNHRYDGDLNELIADVLANPDNIRLSSLQTYQSR